MSIKVYECACECENVQRAELKEDDEKELWQSSSRKKCAHTYIHIIYSH